MLLDKTLNKEWVGFVGTKLKVDHRPLDMDY